MIEVMPVLNFPKARGSLSSPSPKAGTSSMAHCLTVPEPESGGLRYGGYVSSDGDEALSLSSLGEVSEGRVDGQNSDSDVEEKAVHPGRVTKQGIVKVEEEERLPLSNNRKIKHEAHPKNPLKSKSKPRITEIGIADSQILRHCTKVVIPLCIKYVGEELVPWSENLKMDREAIYQRAWDDSGMGLQYPEDIVRTSAKYKFIDGRLSTSWRNKIGIAGIQVVSEQIQKLGLVTVQAAADWVAQQRSSSRPYLTRVVHVSKSGQVTRQGLFENSMIVSGLAVHCQLGHVIISECLKAHSYPRGGLALVAVSIERALEAFDGGQIALNAKVKPFSSQNYMTRTQEFAALIATQLNDKDWERILTATSSYINSGSWDRFVEEPDEPLTSVLAKSDLAGFSNDYQSENDSDALA